MLQFITLCGCKKVYYQDFTKHPPGTTVKLLCRCIFLNQVADLDVEAVKHLFKYISCNPVFCIFKNWVIRKLLWVHFYRHEVILFTLHNFFNHHTNSVEVQIRDNLCVEALRIAELLSLKNNVLSAELTDLQSLTGQFSQKNL